MYFEFDLDDPAIRKCVLLDKECRLLGELLLSVDVVAHVAQLLLHDPENDLWLLFWWQGWRDSGVARVAKIFFCDLDDRELDVGDDEDIAKVHIA